jgi:hypothetical protein
LRFFASVRQKSIIADAAPRLLRAASTPNSEILQNFSARRQHDFCRSMYSGIANPHMSPSMQATTTSERRIFVFVFHFTHFFSLFTSIMLRRSETPAFTVYGPTLV